MRLTSWEVYPTALVKSSDISNSRRDPEIEPPGQTECLAHVTRRRQANVSCYITRNHCGWVCSVGMRAMPPLNLCIPLPPLFQASHCRSVHCSGYHTPSQICQASVQHSRRQSERGYPRRTDIVLEEAHGEEEAWEEVFSTLYFTEFVL